ncbi:MAG: hypothetical protein CMJ15_01580 [Pelagibacterium sp.]|nr:hypothetical protein [Pelagibacterium sp.]
MAYKVHMEGFLLRKTSQVVDAFLASDTRARAFRLDRKDKVHFAVEMRLRDERAEVLWGG